ncbi:MAG: glutathione peroxidase [Rickettsiales bacterium]|nr:glutathione peroxidase [Rickettsiales bacterium]
MKYLLTLILGIFIMWPLTPSAAETPTQNAYDFSFNTLMGGEPMPLSNYKGKVLLIVNTASKCGFTGQYEGLEKLYTSYKDKGLVVIGVPSNDFGAQEPGSSEEIANFCKLNYGVSFPMASKEAVSGDGAHPFYQYAKKTLGFGTAPKWNFHKYLINRKGVLIDYFNSTTSPDSTKVKTVIESALSEAE